MVSLIRRSLDGTKETLSGALLDKNNIFEVSTLKISEESVTCVVAILFCSIANVVLVIVL